MPSVPNGLKVEFQPTGRKGKAPALVRADATPARIFDNRWLRPLASALSFSIERLRATTLAPSAEYPHSLPNSVGSLIVKPIHFYEITHYIAATEHCLRLADSCRNRSRRGGRSSFAAGNQCLALGATGLEWRWNERFLVRL